jgi:uncharacterized protein YuzB (UPF0349 family)
MLGLVEGAVVVGETGLEVVANIILYYLYTKLKLYYKGKDKNFS